MNARLTRQSRESFCRCNPGGLRHAAGRRRPERPPSRHARRSNFLASNSAAARSAPLAYESTLNAAPSSAAKSAEASSLADAEPITDGPSVRDFEQQGRASWYGRRLPWPQDRQRRTLRHARADRGAPHVAAGIVGSRDESRSIRRSVVVKINDRGPYARGRVIDLSYAAAAALGMRGAGTER